jgi:hypothetical protein
MASMQARLKQHFTDAKQINQMMCHLLGPVDGCTVLEPCVGHGAFLKGLNGRPKLVDVIDVDDAALEVVRSQFEHLPLRTFHADFVDLFVNSLPNSRHPINQTAYDRTICNPPYGLFFDLSYRKEIKRAFPNVYARESYGLFFSFALSRLRPGGTYVFLLPDTFLSSRNHRPLRAFACTDAAPTHVIRFPSKLFETVNFGYGNLCIIAGERRELRSTDQVQWLDLFGNDADLSLSRLEDARYVPGSVLLAGVQDGWSSSTLSAADTASQTLAEVADCKTGIYSGDNERFLGFDVTRAARQLNGHKIDWDRQVYVEPLSDDQRRNGLEGQRCYVPLIRGGHRLPFEFTAWAIDWSLEAVKHYREDKKARLQNARFYFKSGLSVPMVTTKRISAALLESAVFDQGVVGVFPHRASQRAALLLYLNSAIASQKMKALVNGSANNSANYLKRLPVPRFSEADELRAIAIVDAAQHSGQLLQETCDAFIRGLPT